MLQISRLVLLGRTVCALVGLSATVLLVDVADAAKPKPPKPPPPPPNILFAFADDWGRYASIFATADGPG